MKCPHCNKETEEDYQTIISKELKIEFRIYKWESKPIKDFKIPKDFSFTKHSDFVYLHDNDLFELEKYPVEYFVENYSKKNVRDSWEISGLCLYGYSGLNSRDECLAGSDDYGRVVISREIEG